MQPPRSAEEGRDARIKQFREASKTRAEIKYGPVAQQIVEYLTRQRPSRKTYAGVPGENRFVQRGGKKVGAIGRTPAAQGQL